MTIQTPSRPARSTSVTSADIGPSPKAAIGWLAGGAALMFAVSWLGTTVLGLQHDLYYLIYLTFALGYLSWFATKSQIAWREVLRRNIWWSLGLGALVAFALARQIMGGDGTPHPQGGFYGFELVWRGVVYGSVDALILFVFPAVIAYLVLRGNRKGLGRKAAFAGLVLLFSLVVSTTYHLGYSTYRGSELSKPLIGTVIADVPAMLTGNPAGAIVAHVSAHSTAVVHQYYGGDGTNRSLPPELTSSYQDHPGGTAALAIAAIWIVLLGSVLALNRRRIRELLQPGDDGECPAVPDLHHWIEDDMYTLEIDRVTKRYGHDVVVNDLSFTVRPARVTGFLGPNGAGKSTTMKVLLDLASADHGRATFAGTRFRDLADPVRSVGVVLEPNAFHPGRSGRNHLRVLADGAGIAPSRIEVLLEMVGLARAADRHVGGYSLGMRQRLGLAAALLGDPSVLILDEPGNGLDPQGIRWLRDLLRERAAAGGTVFVSSHLLGEIEHLADEVVVINHGRLVAKGALSDLQQAGASVRTPEPERLTRLLQAVGATVHTGRQGELVVRGVEIGEIGDRACRAGVALHELTPQAGSLEELFLDWTNGDDPNPNDAATAAVAEIERQAVPL